MPTLDKAEDPGRELVRQLAGILTTRAGKFVGMATILSPWRAVAPLHLIKEAEMLVLTGWLGFLRPVAEPDKTVRFTVGLMDEKTDLAFLQLTETLPLQREISFEDVFDSPPMESHWISASATADTWSYMEGILHD